MARTTGFFTKLSEMLDTIAGACITATMLLIVGNVVGRLFGRPFGGTYEWTGFLTLLAISLALAYCSLQGGHIAITFLVDRMSARAKLCVELLAALTTCAFLFLGAWALIGYARDVAASGEVASTTQIPFYPFIYIMAFAILVFALVALGNGWETFKRRIRG